MGGRDGGREGGEPLRPSSADWMMLEAHWSYTCSAVLSEPNTLSGTGT